MSIDTVKLNEIFMDCMLNDNECNKEKTAAKEGIDMVIVEAITCKGFGFHITRLESHREEVKSMLNMLDPIFKKGMSFLHGCMDKDGVHWGEHTNMEQLFTLGIGLGFAKYAMPRKMWVALPGGMPYIYVNTGIDLRVGAA